MGPGGRVIAPKDRESGVGISRVPHKIGSSSGKGGEMNMRENLKKARVGAGLTQQQMADRLGISLRYYQSIESGNRTGDFTLWDTLEDITGIHQRKLREISSSHPGQEENQ